MNQVISQKVDFASNQEIRWCPGCGDFAILAQMKKFLSGQGIAPENIAFISGIGCSSRFPYYLETYGMHSIHGRAPAIATGLKRMRPELQVWVATGDGDALSIGCGHLLHALKRNTDIKILLFNNRIYGLTKGQFSPTSLPGLITGSTPKGTAHEPLHPLNLALAANSTFVARAVDTNAKQLAETLSRAARHRGSVLVEIYQNCHIFNDGAFEHAKNSKTKADHLIELKHGEPMIFGTHADKGIHLNGVNLEVVQLGDKYNEADLLIHDEQADSPIIAQMLAAMSYPHMPEAVGVFRAVNHPTHNELMPDENPTQPRRHQRIAELLVGSESWTVSEQTGESK